MKSSLEETAQALVVLAEHERRSRRYARSGPAGRAARRGAVWQCAPRGRVVARSHSAPVEPWPVPLFEGHQQAIGLAVFTIAGQRLWLQVAQPLAELRHAQSHAASRRRVRCCC